MSNTRFKDLISKGQVALGIEFGSTRIKSVLITFDNEVIASGVYSWENKHKNGFWTYSQEEIIRGLQGAYQDLKQVVIDNYGMPLKKIDRIGISAMMHGYLAFNEQYELLVPFRTWRNTNTEQAANELTKLFDFHIPLRWSIAHLYQAILDKEEHVSQVAYINTLAGMVHYLLTGEHVLGIGDASGMFPIDTVAGTYDEKMLLSFSQLSELAEYTWDIKKLLPRVLVAGEVAGSLTSQGALLLDIGGDLEAGAIFCPPEGDAGTGMVATNSIRPKTGNISAGTSIFAMLVLENQLKKNHPEIDVVTTPVGNTVAMVHSNNCSTELNAWASLFKEFSRLIGSDLDISKIYEALFTEMLKGNLSEETMIAYPYHSGEDIAGLKDGALLFVRSSASKFNLANFMKAQLYGAFATMAMGLRILKEEEGVEVHSILGHGGIFKTKVVAQRLLAAALDTPVQIMDTASEGGAWGIALLANYTRYAKDESLEAFLNQRVFDKMEARTLSPLPEDVTEFDAFLEKFIKGLSIAKEVEQTI